MPGSDDEILIRIAADVAKAVEGLSAVVTQMGTMAESITSVNDAATASAGVSESFAETWVTGVDESAAASVAWGVQMSKAFDLIGDAVEDVVGSLPKMIAAAADAGDAAYTMSQRLNVRSKVWRNSATSASKAAPTSPGWRRPSSNWASASPTPAARAHRPSRNWA